MTDTRKKLGIYLTDPAIPVMATVAAVGLSLAARRTVPMALALMAFGWGLYVVQEHLIHRFIFHAPAPGNQWLFDALYRLHYGHHDQMTNKHLLFTPLWFSLPMTFVNIAIMAIVLPLEDAVIAALAGGVAAYLLFEWLHLTSHFRTSAKGRLGRYVTRRHGKHHHVDYANWYTVSPGGQLVDQALRADPAEYRVVPNVRTCGLDADDPRLLKSQTRFGFDASLANKPAPMGGVHVQQAG